MQVEKVVAITNIYYDSHEAGKSKGFNDIFIPGLVLIIAGFIVAIVLGTRRKK
ncbi:hypothetical protein LJC07_07360 [Christensenellaceae bacterium OttesenSCG-928-L17]|nr:hypothetical protein [Christensenellaceae bacterium OttesenSCG-928-L17]